MIGQLIVSAFVFSRQANRQLGERWIAASYRAGGLLKDSMMSRTIQRIGDLDALCRSLENDLLTNPSTAGVLDLRENYHAMFSEIWIGQAYSVCYVLKTRKLLTTPEFIELFNDLRMVRVQLKKYELASDNKLKTPMSFIRTRRGDDEEHPSEYVYDPNDDRRAHIGRRGISDRRSMMWEVINHKTQTSRWTERTEMADRMLAIFTEPRSAF